MDLPTTSRHRTAARRRRWGALLVATSLLVGSALVAVSQASAATTKIDDRSLRRSGTWKKVKAPSAYKKTLSRATKKGARLTARAKAVNGGKVVLQLGRSRGTATILVGGKKVRTIRTAAKKTRLVAYSFKGRGTVVIKVAKPGRKGVYVDSVTLAKATTTPTAPRYAPGAITQVDTSASGQGGDGESVGYYTLSPNGNRLAFWSKATNLVPGVADGHWHLYVKTVAGAGAGGIVVVDRSATGALSNDTSSDSAYRGVSWSSDSTRLAFVSAGTNIDPTITGSAPWVYVKNVSTGAVEWVTDLASEVAWSPNGQWLAYSSRWDPVHGVVTSDAQIYAHKVGTSVFNAVSASASGFVNSGYPSGSSHPVWSPDSTRIAFVSYDTTLVPGDTNAAVDVFVKTVASGTTGAISRVSTTKTGAQANNRSEWAAWSPDGKRLAFDSLADNLVPGDNNSSEDVFVKTLATGAITAVSVDAKGEFQVGDSRVPQWSPDGTRIAFVSETFLLAPVGVDVNVRPDVYVKTLATGATLLVSVRPNGANGNSSSSLWGFNGSHAAWSPDSRALYFTSYSSNFSSVDHNAFGTSVFRKTL